MKRPLIEACVDSYASAMAASRAGADRLELCAHLVIGGTTPTHALFRQVQRGSGVKRTNIAGIAAQTGITTFHTTGRKGSVDSGMRYRKEGVSMGLPSLSEYELWLTDEAEFRACAETVHALGTPGAQA